MAISQAGLGFIKDFEKLRLVAYRDGSGIWTIGYGTTFIDGRPVMAGTPTCTEAQALQYLAADCAKFERDVLLCLQPCVLLQNQLDALISFAYNVGGAAFASSTLCHMIKTGQPVLEYYFTAWDKETDPKTGQLVISPGLLRRRHEEYQIYAIGDYNV